MTERFSTFTGMAFTGVRKLPDALASRCIMIALQRAGIDEAPEHLVDGSSDKLNENRRKFARWGQDLIELPKVDRPRELRNRLGDNWYVIRQIAWAAGNEWYRRAMVAAVTPTAPAEQNVTLALLDAVWRVFNETGLSRLYTADLIIELRDRDDGRWSEAHHGGPITPYYLRDNLTGLLPPNPEAVAPRRWRGPGGTQQFGYDVLHFKDAFQRYLGRGLPGQAADKGETRAREQKQDREQDAEPEKDRASKRSARKEARSRPPHPPHPSQDAKTPDPRDAYAEADGEVDAEIDAHGPDKGDAPESPEADASEASASPSASEIHEREQSVTEKEVDEVDEADTFTPLRAHYASAGNGVRNSPRGAVGRKPRKG